ncbi:mucin-17-like isoform X2 [Asterias rubens]|uniref:mucin-17-like isoform X2 n=1 Tax=Asterias rubens TaxID=7604 RepID=UPI0014558525|nr:mucin-17-like isoform X2 [Asterias rubens]
MSTEQSLMCPTCKLDYTTWGQYEEHFWSLIHHKQLENQYGSGQMHICSLCNSQADSLSSYAKHLVSDNHRIAIKQRRQSKQLQEEQNQRQLRAVGPSYSQQTYPGGLMKGSWQQNQRNVWRQYFHGNHNSNSSQNRTWSAKMDFEAPQKKVTGPYSSSMNSSSLSSFARKSRWDLPFTKSSARTSRWDQQKGSFQTTNPSSVKQTAVASTGKGTCITGVTRSAIEVEGHSSGVNSSLKQNNTKENPLSTTIKATSKVIQTNHLSKNSSVPKLSSHSVSSKVKDTILTDTYRKSGLSRLTVCESSCTGDLDKNGKKRSCSSESEKTLKYQKTQPSTSTPAIGESTVVKNSASGLKSSKSEDKQGQEKSTDQKKSTSRQEKTSELLVADKSENRTNANSQSNVIKSATESGTESDLKKAKKISVSQTPDGIGKVFAAGEISTSLEQTKKVLDLGEENVIKKIEENLTSDGTSKTDSKSAQTKASTAQASSISNKSEKGSELNSLALPSSPVDGKSQNTLVIGKTPPEVTRLNLPQSNPELGEKDPSSLVTPGVASTEDPLESIELSGEASVTRVQLPPSLRRELTKLLVKSQGPRPRVNLAAARSRLHAGEHPQAQVVESPDRMVQQLLMKLLDSPKSQDRQVQQIEELQRLLIQASKKGSERARFGVQQIPEISLEVLESLLKSGQLIPLLSDDGTQSDQNHPLTLHANEPADSTEQLRRPFLVNSPVDKPHPERGTKTVIKEEKVESETHIKTEPPSPEPNTVTIKSEPDLDTAAPTDVASSTQTMPSAPQTLSSTVPLEGGSSTDNMIQTTNIRSLPWTLKSRNQKEVCNLPKEADSRQQPVLTINQKEVRNPPTEADKRQQPVSTINQKEVRNPPTETDKLQQPVLKTPRKRRTSQKDLKDILLQLSLKEERFHKRLITVESSLKTTKELICRKQQHFRKLKEQRIKISQDVMAIRTQRLQLLKEATTSSLISPVSQRSLTKACRKKCLKPTSQVSSCRKSSSCSTPVSGLLSSLLARSSSSCPVTKQSKNHATSVACTNFCPVTKVLLSGSSVKGKSQGLSGRIVFKGPVFSTGVVSGATPGSKLSQSVAAGSSLQNPVKSQTTKTKLSLSRAVTYTYNSQTTAGACTTSYSVTNTAGTYKVSLGESCTRGKSQGTAGQTVFQGPVSSTGVVSGVKAGTKLPQSIAAGSRQNPVKSRTASKNRPVKHNYNIQKTTGACTNPYSVSNSTPTYKVSSKASSLQGKSQGLSGGTLFQGSVSSTPVSASVCSSGSEPLTSSFKESFFNFLTCTPKKSNSTPDSVDKPQPVKVKEELIDAGISLSCPVNKPCKIQASVACTNLCSVANSTTTDSNSFRESSLDDKSQGPADGTLFQISESSPPVSASGSCPGSEPLTSSSTVCDVPVNNTHAEATTAGSAEKSNTTSDSVDKPQSVKVKVEPTFKVKEEPTDKVKEEPRDQVKVEPTDHVKVEPTDQVKVEPVDPGYQDVGDASLQAPLVTLPKTSLFKQSKNPPSSLFGTSTSSNTLPETRVEGQSMDEKQIIEDVSNTEQTNQDHQAPPVNKRRIYRAWKASPASKKAKTSEGFATAESPNSEARYPIGSAIDTSTLEVPSAVIKSPGCTSVCEKWIPVLKLRKIDQQVTRPIVKTEKTPSRTTNKGKGSSPTPLDLSVYDISSDSESSAIVEPITRKAKSSVRKVRKLSALRTHSPSPRSSYEQQSIPGAKCGIFRAHSKAVQGMCSVKGKLCTVSADSTAKLFSIKHFSRYKVFKGHRDSVNCVSAWSSKDPDTLVTSSYLFTGSSDGNIRMYSMQIFACEKVICCNSRVTCFLLRSETLYAGLANGCVTVINLKDFTTETFQCKRDIIIQCMITAKYEGEVCLVNAYSDNTVGVHALADGKQHIVLRGHTRPVLCLGVFDHHVYSGSADRKVMIHDIRTGVRTKTIKHHGSAITGLIVGTPYLITASMDKKIRLFSAKDGKLGRVIAECPYGISCMIRIKKMLYVGCTTGHVEAIDVRPDSIRDEDGKKKKKKTKAKKVMFKCEWLDCGNRVKLTKGAKHLNNYHIISKKEHQCKWGYCDVVINKALPNCQKLLWKHAKDHIQPQE